MKNKQIWIMVALIVLAMLLYQISGILLPFVLAFILAYALNPVVEKISKKLSRSVVTGCIVIGVILLSISLVLILVPILQSQIMDFLLRIPNLTQLIWDKLKAILTYGRQNMTEQQLYQLSDSVSGMALNLLQGISDIENTVNLAANSELSTLNEKMTEVSIKELNAGANSSLYIVKLSAEI